MDLSSSERVKTIQGYFTSDFERAVFGAALQSFDEETNPLRLNNFATALRELGRIHLERVAPDKNVERCVWFEQKTNQVGKPVIERAQRVKYAIQAELPDDFVKEILGIEIDDTIREYTRLISRLNKYTHINPSSFNIPANEAVEQAKQALEVFYKLFTLTKERHDATRAAAESAAQDALRDVLYGEVTQELDRLSTHTSVEGVDLYNLQIASIDSEMIRYKGYGNVDVRLQYGSGSDVERDDGVVSSDSYPLTCEFHADTCSPLEISVSPGALIVDTDSFYE